MSASRTSRVQDSIHGLMEFKGTETAVVNVLRARELQRLRRVRQLGLAHLVFPGAEHSRLVHSLGAAHLAVLFSRHLREAARDRIIPFLQPGPAATRDLALAALCHDLGHGPLSHLWDTHVVGDDFDRRAWATSLGLDAANDTWHRMKWHELVGQALLLWSEGELHRLLEQHERGMSSRIAALLRGEYFLPYLPRLLSSDVDVDRADFMLRDAHQTGVAYGRYDLNWLISTATIGWTRDNDLVVGFDQRKAPRVIEQFLVARRALYDTVYYHKTVKCAEGMVGILLHRVRRCVREGGRFPSAEIFNPVRRVMEGDPLSPRDLLALDDHLIWVFIQHLAERDDFDPAVSDLARRVVTRDLFKGVDCPEDKLDEFLAQPDAYDRLWAAVAKYCPGSRDCYVYVDRSSSKLFNERPGEQAFFIGNDGAAEPIREHSQLLPLRTSNVMRHTRLYVPREAVRDVLQVVRGGR